MRKTDSLILAGLILTLLTGCGEQTSSTDSTPASDTASAVQGPPSPSDAAPASSSLPPFKSLGKTTKTASGLEIDDMTIGTGPAPKKGQYVQVHYVGTLKNGTKFDSSYDRGQPIEFALGEGQVIKGWDEGIASMKVGGRRRLVIPGHLAYGENPPPGTPFAPNETLYFDVTLVSANDEKQQ